mmetsp:Transcript_107715/g.278877  ORF Transcript_107715/g.278877 Transcript_107715/m.278877 type:complete len:93 (-) Transcript_107715:216-494(-)
MCARLDAAPSSPRARIEGHHGHKHVGKDGTNPTNLCSLGSVHDSSTPVPTQTSRMTVANKMKDKDSAMVLGIVRSTFGCLALGFCNSLERSK